MRMRLEVSNRRRRAIGAVLAVSLIGLVPAAQAESFPTRPIKIVVPANPGGGTDVMGRVLSKVMTEQGSVPVVVENKGGASGAIGVQSVVSAPADGYTLLFTLADAPSIFPLLKKNPPYRVEKDLTPLAHVANTYVAFAVASNSPHKTVEELVRQSKQSKMSYGSNGFGTTAHLWLEMFKHATGADLLHVPYKSAAPAMQGLIGGEVDLIVASPASLAAHMEAGRIRPLAVSSPQRLEIMPNVPTMKEIGYPDFSAVAWFGVLGPANMDPAVADKVHAMVTEAVKSPEFKKLAARLQLESPPLSREEFKELVWEDSAGWKRTIDAARIEPID